MVESKKEIKVDLYQLNNALAYIMDAMDDLKAAKKIIMEQMEQGR